MPESIPITTLKARISEVVGRLIHRKEPVFISRKGKDVAALIPISIYKDLTERKPSSILAAKGALADLDDEIEEMTEALMAERVKEKSREVPL